jgi:ABC-2 type transport system ATP-binding protein
MRVSAHPECYSDVMIRFERVSKCFGAHRALDEVTLEIGRGEIFGLLGPNGAGKSTAFGLLLTHLALTSGDIYVRGRSLRAEGWRTLRGVGAVLERPAFYDYLSGWENLRLLASYSGSVATADLAETVRLVGLGARIHDPVRVYSAGMRRRLALAQALVPGLDLLLLDEPTEGLDAEGIEELRALLVRLNCERGVTVVLSSHLLSEVERTCKRVAILQRGQVVFAGRWQELDRGTRVRLEVDDPDGAARALAGITIERVSSLPDGYEVVCALLPDGCDPADLVAALVTGGVRVRRVEPVRRALADVYLQATRMGRDPSSVPATG